MSHQEDENSRRCCGLSNVGEIQLILGPMFSGKTTEMMRRIRRFEVANHSCVILKYAKDNRYDVTSVATHDRQKADAISCFRLRDVAIKVSHYDVIGIDEGQFFEDIASFSERLANQGKTVIIAALDGTFQRKAFNDILLLIPLAESVVKLSAVCMSCYRRAAFTKRLGRETKVEIIGGSDKYMAVCRECYHGAPPLIVKDLNTNVME